MFHKYVVSQTTYSLYIYIILNKLQNQVIINYSVVEKMQQWIANNISWFTIMIAKIWQYLLFYDPWPLLTKQFLGRPSLYCNYVVKISSFVYKGLNTLPFFNVEPCCGYLLYLSQAIHCYFCLLHQKLFVLYHPLYHLLKNGGIWFTVILFYLLLFKSMHFLKDIKVLREHQRYSHNVRKGLNKNSLTLIMTMDLMTISQINPLIIVLR